MHPVSSRIWTRVAVSIFYDYNHDTMGPSQLYRVLVLLELRGACNKFPDFLQAFNIVVDFEISVGYCYTSYEMTDQVLLFQLQMNSFSRNWHRPY